MRDGFSDGRRAGPSVAILLSAVVMGLIAAVAVGRTLSPDGTPPPNVAILGVLWLLIGMAILLALLLARRLGGEDG
jgi:hypothetical protein